MMSNGNDDDDDDDKSSCCAYIQAVLMYNATYIPHEDPLSVTNATATIRIESRDPRPRFGEPYYDAVLPEESENSTAVQGLGIEVTNRNLVCTRFMLLAHNYSYNYNNNYTLFQKRAKFL